MFLFMEYIVEQEEWDKRFGLDFNLNFKFVTVDIYL